MSEQPRNTREKIQKTAIELFSEQGYEQTSLREIADRLGVTKAALYYHFKTKEEIAASFFDSYASDVDEICEWAEGEPRSIETRIEIVRRYSEVIQAHVPVLKFMYHNQAALSRLDRGSIFRERIIRLHNLMVDENDPLINKLRAWDSLSSLYSAWITYRGARHADPGELYDASMQISISLLQANDAGTDTLPSQVAVPE
ncbi:TetR/AcrR family transcriptional regulator [Natronoglycomyces albus]|uniref:TetR/AcrR family transcriptional regulator n=1 Tax=Natronoglycomyces albus TaxID=2811108 RepID=A0A895XLL8_9ACTN|nr:TetR/AcrR family transcriptional regulator [Natronoglycomyces albus]QSB04443.1 TetR/AcrR family transcriptional regulator [Natronoglycomyces albus]